MPALDPELTFAVHRYGSSKPSPRPHGTKPKRGHTLALPGTEGRPLFEGFTAFAQVSTRDRLQNGRCRIA